ncbi:MAG: outer membrane lipoprotein-sorting protein [Gammaproteobacteria bacterium]|jgi:outer membrane lipoprotein-sorting protein|nr:outer membrane lipoprotein-sorting protein [Gammaproteobacteria bacterium]
MKQHTVALLVLLGMFFVQAHAETPEEKGLQIATEVDRRDRGFEDSIATMQMVLRNRHGDESSRKVRVRTLEVENDGDKSLSIFDAPADVKGTAFLAFSHFTRPDDQWLYLPALKRVKRIASKNKSGPFMGSEFAYEDISSDEADKFTYKYLRDGACDELECYVVERYPVDEYSGYTRQVVWYDKTEYRPQKVEYYDRKNEHLKTLTFHEYRQYLDQYWRGMRYEMVNHQTGKSTTLFWKEYTFRNNLTDRDFDKNTLKRAR